jgi:CRISPR/Cas system CSM-associated protein Csm3 (group 7 of RAMP superfamily)
MNEGLWHGSKSRKIVKRVVVKGELILQTPAHFGSGDEAGALMPLIVDEREGKPLLTGASIAGALRSYLWSLEKGYGEQPDEKNSKGCLSVLLFGGVREDEAGEQSRLIVDDALGNGGAVELRDGVKINSKSRTAEEKKLYTFLVWQAGTKFPLRFELLICEGDDESKLHQALAAALSGLQRGEIALGARKTRGYGRATVNEWKVRTYDMRQKADLLAWLRNDETGNPADDLFKALNAKHLQDQRKVFTMEAEFTLRSTLLIRAASDVADMAHLRSGGKSVLSGTSLAGAIRARALKIANTLHSADSERAAQMINALFGAFGDTEGDKAQQKERMASRITFEEHTIDDGQFGMVQSRVSIDRFTGGALDTALFNQQPHIGGTVKLKCRIKNPEDHEIGLLLLVLKDLWTGDLALGGEASVGRGRLLGKSAVLRHNGAVWRIQSAEDGKLSITGDRERLEDFVKAVKA